MTTSEIVSLVNEVAAIAVTIIAAATMSKAALKIIDCLCRKKERNENV